MIIFYQIQFKADVTTSISAIVQPVYTLHLPPHSFAQVAICIFRLLIGYVESDDYVWKGYLYAALFFLTSILTSFFFHMLFHIGMTLGMRVKSAVIAVVYKKVRILFAKLSDVCF